MLVEPLLAGLHAGDPSRLSTLATFPELRRWELDHALPVNPTALRTEVTMAAMAPI